MSLANNKSKDLIEKLKPHVSGFSEQIRSTGEHKQKVVCGGSLVYFVDSRDWSDKEPPIVYGTIDDAVGETLIVVPASLWDEADVGKDDVVIVGGILWQLKKEATLVSRTGDEIKRTRFDPLRVLVNYIKKLK